MDIEAIRRDTAAGCREGNGGPVDHVTEALIAWYETHAAEASGRISGETSGNEFVRKDGKWYWKDSIGSQCGKDRSWIYTPKEGAWYQLGAGKCANGESWTKLYIV